MKVRLERRQSQAHTNLTVRGSLADPSVTERWPSAAQKEEEEEEEEEEGIFGVTRTCAAPCPCSALTVDPPQSLNVVRRRDRGEENRTPTESRSLAIF